MPISLETLPENKDELIKRLESIISFLPGNVYLKHYINDSEDICLWCNQNFADFMQLPKEKIINKNSKEFLPEKILNLIIEADVRILKSGIETTLHEHAYGKTFLTRKIPLRDSEDKPYDKILGISIDVTKETIATNFKIDYLETIISFLPGNVYLTEYISETENVCLWANDNLAKFVNAPSKEAMIGNSTSAYLPPEIIADILKADLEILKTGKETTVYENALGRVFYSRKIPVRDNDDAPYTKILGISIDVTSEINAAEFKKEQEIAEEKAKTMHALAGSIAHELRTPLAILKLNVDDLQPKILKLLEGYQLAVKNGLIEESSTDNEIENLDQLTLRIQRASSSASKMIEMLLMNISFEPERLQSEFEIRSILADTQQAVNEFPYDSGEENLIQINTANDFNYFGNSILTKHILFNLIKNSMYFIKAARKGEISIHLKSTADKNCLIFKDTAMGISTDELNAIFERHYTTRSRGTGLGLAFCKMVMDSYQGTIACESEEGQHTTFILGFPI